MEREFQFSYGAVRNVVFDALTGIMNKELADVVYEHVMGDLEDFLADMEVDDDE